MKFSLIVIASLISTSAGFTISSTSSMKSCSSWNNIKLQLSSSSNDSNENMNSASRIEGNRRRATIQEISIMDDMITKLAKAKPYELPQAVSKAIRVISSPQFFLRIAERADQATDRIEKEQLQALASNLVTTLEAVVSTTEDKLDERAKSVEKIVKAAAEPVSGEFLVPLSNDRLDAMRQTMEKINPAELDEGFLSTVDAWMNKSHQDGLDGMVAILQKVLQIYAGNAISRAKLELQTSVGAAVSGKNQAKADKVASELEKTEGSNPASVVFDKLLNMDTDLWEAELRFEFTKNKNNDADGVSSNKLMAEVQRTIEAVVLGLENGSMAQRVQAEYLRELVTRIETVEKQV